MNQKSIHKTRYENKIKHLRATERATRVFTSVSALLQLALLAAIVATPLFYYSVKPVESRKSLEITFGEKRTTNIFPTTFISSDWSHPNNALTQDLTDNALYQDFSKQNAAYLSTTKEEDEPGDFAEEPTEPPPQVEIEQATTTDPSPDSGSIEKPVPIQEEPEPETPTVDSPTESAPSEEPPAVSAVHSELYNFAFVGTAYPLAQATYTTTTDETTLPEPPPVTQDLPTSDNTENPEEPAGDELPDNGTGGTEVAEETAPGTYQITLENFDTAALEGGHFVDGLQLRLSFAARLKEQSVASGTTPYVEVLFGSDERMQSVGVILLDAEVSNAINGGYHLFALPSFVQVQELKAMKVIVRYHGNLEAIDGMFLDAAWLELNTRLITAEDLRERGLPDQLKHLAAPELSVLLSDQLNFARTENPIFNLRYESKQNFILRGFMKLIGQDSLSIERALLVHETLGELPISPRVNVTKEGLITIEVPERDTHRLQPGTYHVVLVYKENGFEYTDRFDFQWGILTMNPLQSEYETGETAEIHLGALSPNGNTLCEAILDLYITDPMGFVSKVPVVESGLCNGNTVVAEPDYTAEVPTTVPGEYKLYLERLDEKGTLLGFTSDTFWVVENQQFAIIRDGPTRIYPGAPYEMNLTVKTAESFAGTLYERVPVSFIISSTTATITQDGDWQILSWNISTRGESTDAVRYSFDAPDISPYIYALGSAWLEGEVEIRKEEPAVETAITESVDAKDGNASSTEDDTSEVPTETPTENTSSTSEETVDAHMQSENQVVFREHRQWQIASDATGSMLLLWAGATIPSGWTCVSCVSGDPFYQRFIVGSSTAGNNGGATTHTHTAGASVNTTGSAGVSNAGGGGTDAATNLHTHTLASPTIGSASNLPSYRHLVIIQHNSAGEPTSVPAGAIAIFDAAVPSGWTQYNSQNGFYVRGESATNLGGTGGSNTHTHTITGTLSGPTGTTNASNGPTSVANQTHTHTISSSTASQNIEPPYIEVILGQLNATTTMPDNAIAMWTDTEPSGWDTVSSSSQPFANRFFKPAATYGTAGGASSHTPADVNGIVSSGPSGTNNRQTAGTSNAIGAHTHTVNVTGFSTATHLPPYRSVIVAKRAGGGPPDAPTVHELFDNEKTGTSTPEFEFTANDPYGTDTLVYQFQWDDDADLEVSPIGDRTSDVETGCSPNCFENTVNGDDSSPFTENERIRFTIQSALTNNTTYYFRVRAKKTIADTWGAWSTVQSFTYVADTDPSQWFQTADDQFDTGTFSNAETFGSDSVRIVQDTPVEALVVYGEGAVQTPRYQLWDGDSWGGELSAQSVGGTIQWVRTAAGTTRDEYILGTHDASNDVNVQIFDGVSDTWGDLLEVTAGASDTTRRAFDVAYETLSGDAIVVYCDGDDDPAYRVWDGSSWVGPTSITTVSANDCNWIQLASDPTSDEIILVTRDDSSGATDYEALVWNGSSFGNSVTMGTMSDTNHEGIAVAYEESGGQAVVAVSNGGASSFLWTAWNGTEWSTPTAHTIGNDFEWGVMKRDLGTDNIIMCYMDQDVDLGAVQWNGESWNATFELDTSGFDFDGRGVSCEYEVTSGRDGRIMTAYSDASNARYRDGDGTSFDAEVSISTITESWEVGTTRTGDGKILAYFHDEVNTQYDFSYWDGTTWSAAETLEGSPSVTADPRRQPIHMTAKIYQPAEGSITSDPIDFSLVPNRPTWGEATWNTTEPNGTAVEIQVLYATTSACNTLVPDGALPGNSTGFQISDSPLDLSGLSTSTYSALCLRATLTTVNESVPTLDDWTLSWERQPFLVQSQFRWYVNANSENPSDVWPSGATNLNQNEAIPQEYSPGSGNILRLRMALRSDNAALEDATLDFKLQYSETTGLCASSTAWFDVGAIGSSTAPWRGYNNLLAFDGSTLSTLLLGSDVGGTYEEENDSDLNPNTINVGDEAEWDWVLQHNGADDGVQYCFRMVTAAGVDLSQYDEYPALVTNDSPLMPSLEIPFDNEQLASTTPWFEFVTEDIESNDVTYQIQVDNNYDFSSTVLDRNSTTHFSEFENIVTPADKDPFTIGQTVRFIPASSLSNGTTYYWRVRAKDGAGSNDWGEWSTIYSFTVNTTTGVTTWYQTEQEQFATSDFSNAEATANDDVIITTGFATATTTSTAIDFDDRSTGNAWGTLSWGEDLTDGSILYRVEYSNGGVWELVPDSFLPGNSSGFSSDPVSLLSLDPQVHNEIRIRANLTDSGGTPRLQDWTVEWGFAVEQPTLISLFDNEKTGTTTPALIFKTTDPESDDIEYEVSWSTDNTFTSSTTRRSGVAAGFTNDDDGGDTSPFTSGDTIRYEVQSADALIDNTTYWWRVRGRDPSGGNTWSVWSEARSFTVDTTVTVSTWFQTTDEQFETNSLNDTESTGSDAVGITSIIREAFLAYAEGTVQTPRYRIWNGSAWTDESSADSVGGTIRFVETAAAPTRDEYIVVTQDSTGRVRAQVYNGTTETFSELNTIITAVPNVTRRGFDVVYETSSGNAMVVACNGTEATYKTWDGTNWSSANPITLGVSTNCNWIKMAADPVLTSNEIIMVVRDATTGATDYEAQVWSGSAWGNTATFGSMGEGNDEGMAVEYEESGERAVVVVSNGGASSFVWNAWTGTNWVGATTQGLQDDFENGRMVQDEGSDNLALCTIDQDGQIALVRWIGTTNSWNSYTTIDTVGNSKVGRPFGCAFETTTGRDGYIMVPYSDDAGARYVFWDGSALSTEANISTIQDSFEVRSARTGDGNILSIFYDDINTQYDFSYWNGVNWSTLDTLEATAITTTAPATIPLDIVTRRYPTFTTGSVVSSPIVFSDGSGLKWQSFSFSDTTPGSSDITYQLEYLNGDTWSVIPNSALAGNETGFTTSPVDISQISRITYHTIRLRANLSCAGGNCPSLSDWTVTWSEGINVSGTVRQYDQTSSTTVGTVAVAVNGVIQTGKTSAINSGAFSITNVRAFVGDIITVFVSGATDATEAVGVTRYDGDGDITGLTLFERHLTLGSNDATTTPLTNADISSYDFTATEDIFFDGTGSTITMCATTGCADTKLYIKANVRYVPGGRFVTHDFVNYGYFTAGSFTHEINGSWDNNATSTMTGSTIVFAATSSSETLDSTGAIGASFNNVTFGTTTGSGVWSLNSTLDIDGALTVSRGTLARANTLITVAGNLTNGANGTWTGLGTTTFDGNSAALWRDQNATLQNVGRVVVDGSSKAVTLASNVAAHSIFIGANDTLDASTNHFDITVYDSWVNQNNFVARSGEIFFAATTSGKTITTAGDAFYDLTFSGSGGGWSFRDATVLINNDFRSTAGTVTLPTATTTVAGSFLATTGSFGNNNGTILFTSSAAESITFTGGAFTNVAHNLWFNGSGSWTFTDANATSTNDVRVQAGTVNFPSGIFAIGGGLADTGGVFTSGAGTILFYSTGSESITAGGSSFNNVQFAGTGSWSFTDVNATVSRNLTVNQGTVALPSGTLSIAGSYDNNATVTPGTGTVRFTSTDGGETLAFGASPLYNVVFDNTGGGWTITEHASTTNNVTITNANALTLDSGRVLSVGGVFTNSVGGAATTWAGSTLALRAGSYSLNAKTNNGDTYGTLHIDATARVSMWNSSATAYNVSGSGHLYSQDHNAVDGDLYIFGGYSRTAGTEYWSYANDFDGTALGGGSRQVDVRFASGASAIFTGSTVNITGAATASTTIANQGSGTYGITISGGTLTAQYYQFADLGGSGVSLQGGVSVPTLSNGSFTVGAAAGSALTLSSTTIDANPSKQIYSVAFATTTGIAATNVSQTDGVPASFWWFRNGTGNLYGETSDNDTGDPGSVRFDDSSLVINISGVVYSDDGSTPIVGGTCDGSTPVVRVVVNGGASYTGSCSNIDGSFSIGGVAFVGDPTITVYLDDAPGGERGSVVTRTPTADITDLDIYANRVIVRNEDVDPISIEHLSVYDSANDLDLRFSAATSTQNTLTVHAGNELFVFASSTFTPGGPVTLAANATANGYDGTLYLDDNATFNTHATSTLTIGGRLVLDSGASFSAGSSTVLMNATTTGKSITAANAITFNELIFNGSGGSWNIGADIIALDDITISAGTVTGTGDISLPFGSLTGNGTLSLGAGTTTLARSNTLGGTSPWTFYNLELGNGIVIGTTTPLFTATTTIGGRLTIAAAHFLDAGNTTWDLSGTGTVFVENGTFLEDTSTVRYSGAGANVRSTTYHHLDINAGAGSQTYTATGLGIIVAGNLTIGGTSNSTFDLNANDSALDANGALTIRTNGIFDASESAIFTLAGNYTNDGTFISNNGTLTIDSGGSTVIAAGNSSFASVHINAAGSITVAEHATATNAWRLLAASGFTVSSGQTLAVGGTFLNNISGAATTFTGSTLHLYGDGNYSINTATTSDSYATLSVDGTTQIRMWNSSASSYSVDSTASLYSQDHASNDGDLYIWGSYRKTSGNDHWSYATDFNGAALGGSARKVDVFVASGGSVTVTGGGLAVSGVSTASTTIQNQGSGTYGLVIGGTASTTFQYYEVKDANSAGLTFTGTPTVHTLSFGNFEVSQNGGSGMTVGGTVINTNPAKNFTQNRFALDGVGSGFNVTATGTSVSAWRFANHYGDIDGEAFDVDPNGDPGYIAWDDSAAQITISGTVYGDEGSTVSSVCDGVTNNIALRVAGITSSSTSCNAGTGAYSFSNIAYGVGDSLIVYIDGEVEQAATVTKEPVSNINSFNIYENRIILRHENANPMTIDDMAVWDSSDDADIPFTAVSGSPDTLTLPANRKLIVWSANTFAPGGNVTLSGGGGGAAYDGTLELFSNADWIGSGTEALSVGGSLILNAGAEFVASNGTTTFTTTGAARTIDLNEESLYHVAFSGSGSWNVTDPTFTAGGNVTLTSGVLDLPTGTSTFSGSFVNTGGSFDANGGTAVFTGPSTRVLRMGGSSLADVRFSGGNYAMTDTNATTTGSVTILSGSITLPSGIFSIGGDFENTSGSITHNTSELVFRNVTSATLLASSSDLHAVRFTGGGTYTMADDNVTFLDDVVISGGSAVTLASGTLAIGGSFDAVSGTFTNATTTILFNSADAGETINPGNSSFYAVQIGAPTGGYTLTGNATTTHNFTLTSAQNFSTQPGVTLKVLNVFTNLVGGTNTNWNGSTLALDGENAYTINTKASGGDQYNILRVGADSDIRMWNSSATTTSVHSSASLYSQDHATVNGYLYIYGDFHIGTTTEYWNYARDFDGTLLTGSERLVTVHHAQNATTTVDGGTLHVVGASGNETTVTNQGSGTYSLAVSAGTFNAQYYEFRNLSATGLTLTGTPTITSLSYGDFELAVNGGTLITLASTTLNANASFVSTGNRFATSSAITGASVTLQGVTSNAWTFVSHTGNLDGEAFDVDGITACGSIRFDDSSCLITQQTQYRWRNDDGGIGVPDNEWYNASWDARQSVRIDNTDATDYTDAVVELLVPYDSDMQADFDDLRFTDSDGTTLIPHWIGSSTDSVAAEVWVKVPALPSEDTAVIYMYYYNPTATSSSNAEDTFIAADDFEDDDIAEYSGQISLFDVGLPFAYDGDYGLDNNGDEGSRANLGGIFRFDQTVSQGETIRYWQYVDTGDGSGDETCTLFGVQSPGTTLDNYAVCLEQFGDDRISLARDVRDNDTSGTVLASSTVSYQTGWYEIEVDWNTDDSIDVMLYDAAGSLVTSISDSDNTYSSGGFGFTFWFHNGGWDSFSSRPILTTEPAIRFGAKQGDSGATWKAPQNTPASYDVGDVARLRIAIENSGTIISAQQFLLEYASLEAAPSCEAVNPANFVAVPPQDSCGTSPVCMQSSTFVTNGDPTGDLLLDVAGLFTAGQYREDPSNITSAFDVDQDAFTELEYALTPTINTVDENLCFRVTDNGDDYDTYLRVARLSLQFEPSVSGITLNGGADIALIPGATTTVYATGTATDLNGYADLTYATSTFYRSGVVGGAACSQDNNNCYISGVPLCEFTNCSGTSCEVSCRSDIYFHADATDSGSSYDGEEWFAFIEVEDARGGYDFDTSLGVELSTLRAIDVAGTINYGSLAVNADTGSTNASTTVLNEGNVEINIEIEGTDMTDGNNSYIPAVQQKFATSTFTYSGCGVSCKLLSSTTPVELDVDLAKPTTAAPPVSDAVYWGIAVPFGVNSAPHQGINVFTPVSP